MSPRRERGGALTVVLLGALVGALVGLALVVPVYRSEGAVRVHASSKGLDEQDLCPWRRGPAGVQAENLRSVRLMEMALASGTWQDAGGGREDLDTFGHRYDVSYDPDARIVGIRFDHESPQLARAGVRALLGAYEGLLRELNGTYHLLVETRDKAAGSRRRAASLEQEILIATRDVGGVRALEVRHVASVERLINVEHDLATVQQAIARGEQEGETVEALREKARMLEQELATVRERARELGALLEEVERLKSDREAARRRAANFDALAAELEAASPPSDAITIEDRGSLPTRPLRPDRSRAALLGALAGASLLLLVVSLLRLR